jgi:hypothetical protein
VKDADLFLLAEAALVAALREREYRIPTIETDLLIRSAISEMRAHRKAADDREAESGEDGMTL